MTVKSYLSWSLYGKPFNQPTNLVLEAPNVKKLMLYLNLKKPSALELIFILAPLHKPLQSADTSDLIVSLYWPLTLWVSMSICNLKSLREFLKLIFVKKCLIWRLFWDNLPPWETGHQSHHACPYSIILCYFYSWPSADLDLSLDPDCWCNDSRLVPTTATTELHKRL